MRILVFIVALVACRNADTDNAEQIINNAEQIINATYDQLGENIVTDLKLSYVRADGTLDAKYGEVEIRISPRPARPEDLQHPIGAPVPVTVSKTHECSTVKWRDGTPTVNDHAYCSSRLNAIARPRCTVPEVWGRAMKAGAPANANALAVVELEAGARVSTWSFRVDDDPRNIHFSHSVPDTCDPTLEKPVPTPRGP